MLTDNPRVVSPLKLFLRQVRSVGRAAEASNAPASSVFVTCHKHGLPRPCRDSCSLLPRPVARIHFFSLFLKRILFHFLFKKGLRAGSSGTVQGRPAAPGKRTVLWTHMHTEKGSLPTSRCGRGRAGRRVPPPGPGSSPGARRFRGRRASQRPHVALREPAGQGQCGTGRWDGGGSGLFRA